MYKSIVCFLAYLCKSACKDNIKYGQYSCPLILYHLNIFVFLLPRQTSRHEFACKREKAGTAETSKYSKKAISQNQVLTNCHTFSNADFINKPRKDLIPALSAKKYRESGGLPISCFLRCNLPTKPNPNIWFVP